MTSVDSSWSDRLLEAIRTGAPIDLAPDKSDDELLPAEADKWPGERGIPAAAIATAVTRAAETSDRSSLSIRAARIQGPLVLEHRTADFPISITNSQFEEAPNFFASKLATLNLAFSQMPGIALFGAVIEGDLLLLGATLTGPVSAGP